MPFYINDFRMDTLDLRTDEIGVYIVLICLAWKRGDGSLPNDMGWLKRSLKACCADFHGHTFNRIVPKLLQRYFQLRDDDKWYQPRVERELIYGLKRSANAAQNARKRWAKSSKGNGLAHTEAMLSQSQRKSLIRTLETARGKRGHPRGGGESLEDIVTRKGWVEAK